MFLIGYDKNENLYLVRHNHILEDLKKEIGNKKTRPLFVGKKQIGYIIGDHVVVLYKLTYYVIKE